MRVVGRAPLTLQFALGAVALVAAGLAAAGVALGVVYGVNLGMMLGLGQRGDA